jgi:pSer/pThr/pTyr-binding forkhead associated (FHA) protein
VFHDGRHWVVEDLGSTNGTFLNRVKVTSPTPIAAGDQLGIGKTIVEVRK